MNLTDLRPSEDPEAFGQAIRPAFGLDEDAIFLNHGSFGAVPAAVIEAQDEWRRLVERQPVDFMTRRRQPALDAARARLGGFIGGGDGRLAFVDNASAGINAVLRSIDWQPGDGILFLGHAYGAVRQALTYIADRHGAVLTEVPLTLPVAGPDAIIDAVAAALHPGLRLAVLDHITSPSALVLPIRDMIALCHDAGLRVLVDGAHAPGMIDLDVAALGADWYAGNCHKWLFAPKGCGFLWARADRVEGLHPTVISHGYGQGFEAEFDWTGTRDFSAWLAVTAAIDFIEDQGAAAIRAYTHTLAREQAARLAGAWGTDVAGPPDMVAAMAAIRLPGARPGTWEAAATINNELWARHRIEVPIRALNGGLWVRISAQIYNTRDEYAALAEAVSALPS
jgi:isopenicillin-N epimerase